MIVVTSHVCVINCFLHVKVVIALGDYMSANCHACIGGTNVREDMRKLEKVLNTYFKAHLHNKQYND